MTDIALYGYGYVGKAVHRLLSPHHNVHIVDPAQGYRMPQEEMEWNRVDHAIICVPTPAAPEGSCDTSIVEGILHRGEHRHYLIKSTVRPGYTQRWKDRAVFSPEYIGEGKYGQPWWRDVFHPTDMSVHPFHVFGGDPVECSEWVDIWQKATGWNGEFIIVPSQVAEMAKYAENMYLAMKQAFSQELFNVCEAHGVNYEQVRHIWTKDARVGNAMTMVFRDKRAFGGKCLPKDSRAIIASSRAHGYEPSLWQAALDFNARQGTPRDQEDM